MDCMTLTDRLRLLTAALLLLAYWLAYALLMLPFSRLLPCLLPCQQAREVGQAVMKKFFQGVAALLRFFEVVECEYVGFARLHAQTGPLIVAPNHPSLWDAVFVVAEVDHVACVLKAPLMRNLFLHGGATSAGFIPNEPTHKMMRRCIELLRGNERVLFFPEGTRTRPEHGTMNPLTGGLAVIAKNADAPVWPIYIQTSSRYLSKGWPIWRLPREKVRLRLTVGDPVIYAKDGETQAFLDELRQRYIDAGCGVQSD
jgi:1-acyl-sn-glycerol-3-phosphate acyltransferase